MKRTKYIRTNQKNESKSKQLAVYKGQPSEVASAFLNANEHQRIRVFVAGGSRSGNNPVYEQEAYQLGRKIGQMGYRLDFGLSSKGIMGAVAKGVLQGWAQRGRETKNAIQGVTMKQYLELYQTDEVLHEVSDIIVAKTLEERKQKLLEADIVVFAPGGVGTLDELVYDCVAMQDGFLDFKPFIMFNVEGFFHHLLEYLKEINLKGFAGKVPFIVVDNAFEAGVAFELLNCLYKKTKAKEEALSQIESLIYKLPYFIKQCSETGQSVSEILARNKQYDKSTAKRQRIQEECDRAYLDKEIERMYARLAKSGVDTAVVSGKLTDLKNKTRKKG